MTMDLSPIIISLKTATLSIIITFFLGAVSYTHLDVYKRQRLYTLVSKPCSEATNIGSFISCELSLAAEVKSEFMF